jgi:hypothetical protein
LEETMTPFFTSFQALSEALSSSAAPVAVSRKKRKSQLRPPIVIETV